MNSMATLFEQWWKKQEKLDEISFREWEKFGEQYPLQAGFDCMCEIVKLVHRQNQRDMRLQQQFPMFGGDNRVLQEL